MVFKKGTKVDFKPRVCIICKEEFKPINGIQKTCSKACKRERANYRYQTRYRNRYTKQVQEAYEKRRKRQKEALEQIFGINCFICGSDVKGKPIYHEKRGKRHNTNLNYLIEHKEDFVLLESRCHYALHFCLSRIQNLNIENFVILFNMAREAQKTA